MILEWYQSSTFLTLIPFSFLQVIAAEGEQKASRALREASEVISESPSALQVSTFICERGSVRSEGNVARIRGEPSLLLPALQSSPFGKNEAISGRRISPPPLPSYLQTWRFSFRGLVNAKNSEPLEAFTLAVCCDVNHLNIVGQRFHSKVA